MKETETKRRYVPPGGSMKMDGTVLSKSQVTAAVRRYARKNGYYARTVRTITVLFRNAVNEYPTG